MDRKRLLVVCVVLLSVLFVLRMSGRNGRVTGTLVPTPNPHPTSSIPRQGVASDAFTGTYPYLGQLGSWVAIWESDSEIFPADYQLVPMLSWRQNLPTGATVQSVSAQSGHNYWLVWNECENAGHQCDTPPEEQAQFYYDHLLPLMYGQARVPNAPDCDGVGNGFDCDAQLIVGGVSAHQCGLEWLSRFIQAYRDLSGGQGPPRAGWHFHVYPELAPVGWQPGAACPVDPGLWTHSGRGSNITNYIEDLERVRSWWETWGVPDDEIWVTETGCLYRSRCPDTTVHPDVTDYMAHITAYYNDGGRWVDRYAWWTDYSGPDIWTPHTWLMPDDTSGRLTDLGVYYAQITPSAHTHATGEPEPTASPAPTGSPEPTAPPGPLEQRIFLPLVTTGSSQ